jgi:hypothetical protein
MDRILIKHPIPENKKLLKMKRTTGIAIERANRKG